MFPIHHNLVAWNLSFSCLSKESCCIKLLPKVEKSLVLMPQRCLTFKAKKELKTSAPISWYFILYSTLFFGRRNLVERTLSVILNSIKRALCQCLRAGTIFRPVLFCPKSSVIDSQFLTPFDDMSLNGQAMLACWPNGQARVEIPLQSCPKATFLVYVSDIWCRIHQKQSATWRCAIERYGSSTKRYGSIIECQEKWTS